MRVSDADIIEALQKYRGSVTSAAKQVGMTRSSLSRRIHRTKHLEEELHEIRETAVDDAEHMLFQKIEEGHVASIIFFLKCFGKDRGYVERPERPRKDRNEKRSEAVMVYLTEAERARLEDLAEQEGVTVAALIMRPWREGE